MRATNAVVLVIDRLGAGWLGPYGNTWLDTPNFNQLAAHGVLCETAIAESAALPNYCRGVWSGVHPLEPAGAATSALPRMAELAGAQAILLTDDSQVFRHAKTAGFAEPRFLSIDDSPACVEDIEQSGFFSFFAEARSAIAEQTGPALMWLHSRGMSGPWDAPLALRYQFADDEDPIPPSLVTPPNTPLGDDFDPDELLGFAHAYAGQVALLDMCLGSLIEAIDDSPLGRETLLIVTSPRGYPLGEHRRVGPCDEALYGELLHVPLLLRFPGNRHALTRSGQILQPRDIFSLVSECCGWSRTPPLPGSTLLAELSGNRASAPGVACAIGSGQRAIRTPAWFLRQSQTDNGLSQELFAKPDDRWEANEVSSRCSEAVELLAAELDRFAVAAGEGRLAEAAPLAELLCDVWR